MPITYSSWTGRAHTFAFASVRFCYWEAKHTSRGCLSLQNACSSLPGSWALILPEFHPVTLCNTQPSFRPLSPCCTGHCGGPGVCVSHTKQLCCGGKKPHASVSSCKPGKLAAIFNTVQYYRSYHTRENKFFSSGFRKFLGWTLSDTCCRQWDAACPRGRQLPWRHSHRWQWM